MHRLLMSLLLSLGLLLPLLPCWQCSGRRSFWWLAFVDVEEEKRITVLGLLGLLAAAMVLPAGMLRTVMVQARSTEPQDLQQLTKGRLTLNGHKISTV